jgi:hypothetical protein
MDEQLVFRDRIGEPDKTVLGLMSEAFAIMATESAFWCLPRADRVRSAACHRPATNVVWRWALVRSIL